MSEGPSAGRPAVCSAKGCRVSAVWELHWNNPTLHTVQRRKIWLACNEHRGYLGDFLERRGFLREITAIEAP
jgi:hypothetical protein